MGEESGEEAGRGSEVSLPVSLCVWLLLVGAEWLIFESCSFRVPYAAANVVEQEWRRRFVGGPRERVVNLNGRDAADLLRAFEEAFVLPRFGRG